MNRINYGLTPAFERECPNCKGILQVWQKWVEGAVKEPPACPVCGETFLTADDGVRVDPITGNQYTRTNRAEYVMVKLLRKGPSMPEGK